MIHSPPLAPTGMPVRLVRLGGVEGVWTQAVYHALAETMTADSPDTILITRPATPYVCLGFHQQASRVLDQARCRAMGLPVVRRRVGGGLTYLDENQLFYQFVFHHTRAPLMPTRMYADLLRGPVDGLRRLGLNARLEKTNEVEVGGRRIAGIGGGRIEEAAVVVGNYLFDFDYQAMSRVWRAPSPQFAQLAAQALGERVTTLAREGITAGFAQVEAHLVQALTQAMEGLGRPVAEASLTPRETAAAGEMAARLTHPDFVAFAPEEDTPPMEELKVSARAFIHHRLWQGVYRKQPVRVVAALRVNDGVIETARLESTPPADWSITAERLKGNRLDQWAAVMDEGK
ncbi:MAG: hypothetical protein OEW12_00175 [Deltaproteobacteria bacterium]|nr:hypothetical protein [Deltaproteobacteria bacterium]